MRVSEIWKDVASALVLVVIVWTMGIFYSAFVPI